MAIYMGSTKHGLPSSATQGGGAPPCLPYSSLLRQLSLTFGAEVLVIFLSIFSFCALAATTNFTLLFGCQPSFQEFAATNLTCLAFAFIHATKWITWEWIVKMTVIWQRLDNVPHLKGKNALNNPHQFNLFSFFSLSLRKVMEQNQLHWRLQHH